MGSLAEQTGRAHLQRHAQRRRSLGLSPGGAGAVQKHGTVRRGTFTLRNPSSGPPRPAMATRRREMRLVIVAAAVMACAADPKKESTRMVDEGAAVTLAQSSRQGAAASASGAAAACRTLATEPQCALQNGCAWCSQKSDQVPAGTRRAASGAMGDEHTLVFVGSRRSLLEDGEASAKDSRSCMAWWECTGPANLCEFRASESACSGSSATESSCVWCMSEGELTSTPQNTYEFQQMIHTEASNI